MQVKIVIREFPLAGAHLGHGDVAVAGMSTVARMFVLNRVRTVHVRVISVAVEPLSVEMDALGTADVAIGIDVHVQTAELYPEETQASGQQNGRLEPAHLPDCSTAYCQRISPRS